jgi:hypothetical protein
VNHREENHREENHREENHREERDTLGIGRAQLWNPTAVPRQPVLAVAAYSALMLAALKVFGAARGKVYAQLPRRRRNAHRPSCLDLITLLRKEAAENPSIIAQLNILAWARLRTGAEAGCDHRSAKVLRPLSIITGQ